MKNFKIQQSKDNEVWQDMNSAPAHSWTNWTNSFTWHDANELVRAIKRSHNYLGLFYRVVEKLVLLVTIFFLLAGCSSVRDAKAAKIRETTRQSRGTYDQRMRDNAALAQTRITTKEVILVTGAVSGVLTITITTLAYGYYLVVVVRAEAVKRSIIFIHDPQGKRFPVLIAGSHLINISTGERFPIGQTSVPNQALIESSTKVQLGNQASDNPKILGPGGRG